MKTRVARIFYSRGCVLFLSSQAGTLPVLVEDSGVLAKDSLESLRMKRKSGARDLVTIATGLTPKHGPRTSGSQSKHELRPVSQSEESCHRPVQFGGTR